MNCWIVRRSGEDGQAERHYYTERQAREVADGLIDDGGTAAVEQLSAPCIEVECQGCGYRIDEDDEGIIHFESIQEAREYLGHDGVFVGDELVRCSADCPGKAVDDGSQADG